MNILVVSQYFWPETFIINQICETLVDQGNKVDALTGKPNYPDGVLFHGYSSGGFVRERMDDKIDIYRLPMRTRGSGSGKNLILSYLSFVASGMVFAPWLLRKQKYDAILVFAPSPITVAIPAILLKWIKGCHMTIWIQDLWPESLSATGFVKHDYLLKCVGVLVKGIYACSDLLLVQSRAFVSPVKQRVKKSKIRYFPNSAQDQWFVSDGEMSNELSDELLDTLEKCFCFVFAGNIGRAQSIETILAAAEKIRDLEKVCIILVGNGSRLEWAQAETRAMQLDNVMFTGRYPMACMPFIFSRAQGLLVTLNDDEIFSYTIPSKIQSYLSAGRPIICAVNGESARIIEESNSGISVPAADPLALSLAMRTFYGMRSEERARMGQEARRYYLKNFEMNRLCQELVETIKAEIKEGGQLK